MNCSAFALQLAELGTLFIMPSVYSPGIPHTAPPTTMVCKGCEWGICEMGEWGSCKRNEVRKPQAHRQSVTLAAGPLRV